MELILASSSPRRREMLSALGYAFACAPADVDETVPAGLAPHEIVEHLARKKAGAAAEIHPAACVVGADTLVFLDGEPLGKPDGPAAAVRMLRALSGREHTVISGVAVLAPGFEEVFHAAAEVRFFPLSPQLIERYAATGEPLDKAGAYGIQGLGSLLVEGITGDYGSVVGLPVSRLFRSLERAGILPAGFAVSPGGGDTKC